MYHFRVCQCLETVSDQVSDFFIKFMIASHEPVRERIVVSINSQSRVTQTFATLRHEPGIYTQDVASSP
jgi:hypothetical protein